MNRAPSPAPAPSRERECPDCGLFQQIPPMPSNGQASCLRCDGTLRRTRRGWSTWVMAFTLTSLVLYVVAVLAPFLTVDIVGRRMETTMLSLPSAFIQQGAWELGILVFVTAIVAPLAKILVVLFVMLGLNTANPPRSLPLIFKWYHRIGPWAMIEVFLLGVFVAFTRLGSIATVNTGVALYAVAALMITMVTGDTLLDADGIWDEMEVRGLVPPAPPGTAAPIGCNVCGRVSRVAEGKRCSRCASHLHRRRSGSFAQTWALLTAAALLYVPANLFPILTVTRLGRATPSTIIGGAQELLDAGMWPLALLVFVASIMVPLFKLASLAFMLATTHAHSAWRLQDRTRIYRLVDFIGRWSMIDVFMLSTLVGLVQAGAIAKIYPDVGAICFGTVVVLTMIATACFDPRQMWDAAGAGALDEAVHPPTHSDRPAAAPVTAGAA